MSRNKKIILISLLAAIVLVGSIAGVVFAQTGSEDTSPGKTLLARVAAILGIDQEKVEDAFAQAQREMRDEALQNLVNEGRLTQEQVDQYKAWLDSRPDMEQYRQQLRDWQQTRPSVPPELEEWQQARPDIPLPPRPFGHFGGGCGGGPCPPISPPE